MIIFTKVDKSIERERVMTTLRLLHVAHMEDME